MALYLRLFHGRKTPDEVLEDWGLDGPVIGPLRFVHTTYSYHVKLGCMDPDGDDMQDLHVCEDMLYYDGVWYGDWTVFGHKEMVADKFKPERYCAKKAEPPKGEARIPAQHE